MSILEKHFERVAELEKQGIPIIRGVFFDVYGTLVDLSKARDEVVAFAMWNAENKLFPEQTIFSRDIKDAKDLLNSAKLTPEHFGLQSFEEVKSKQRIFNDAYTKQHTDNIPLWEAFEKANGTDNGFVARPSYCLELVIDDSPPLRQGVMDSNLVVTHWNPDDPEVERFLKQDKYMDCKI